MSDAIKENITDLEEPPAKDEPTIFRTNKDKLIELLLNEITFLDQCFYKTDVSEVRDQICLALEIFENLLKLQRFTDKELPDTELAQMREFIYHTEGGSNPKSYWLREDRKLIEF